MTFILVKISQKIQFSMVKFAEEQDIAIPEEQVLQLIRIVL